MSPDLLILAFLVGGFTWAFRYLPTRLRPRARAADGLGSRFLAATGPAAIATLFVASILPMVRTGDAPLALVLGVAAVIGVFVWRGSVLLATLAGAAAYGLVVYLSI